MRLSTAAGLVLLGLAATGAQAQTPDPTDRAGFPHEEHEGLFPLCEGCHSGIESAGIAADFPDPGQCARCHDGVRSGLVTWDGPTIAPSNLAFSHAEHAAVAAPTGEAYDCSACHRPPGAVGRMDVVRAEPATCLACHEEDPGDHLAQVEDCQACHLPLTEARALSAERIAAFPEPSTHAVGAFLSSHGVEAAVGDGSCATCHARESCARCHLNGADLASIRALGPDPRVATLEAEQAPEYPEPRSHDGFEWSWAHGALASEDAAGCANCHDRASCTRCHQESNAAVSRLPVAGAGDVRGVRYAAPPLVHDLGFATSHEAPAAADSDTCATCHSESFCTSCHNEPVGPLFHFPNFLQMHGSEAWGNESECSTCHNTAVFCRACHEGIGRGSEGRLDVAYHSRNAFWLFGHGAPARQGLESCATCHSQTDCTQCHAALGAWRINPHGPNFSARRLREANPFSCAACHPGGGPGS